MTTTSEPRVVLLVDDEPAILSLMQLVLSREGYSALYASGGDSALHVADGYDGEIDVLVADIVMPGMTGFELAAELQVERPATRVLFLSGHLDDRQEVLEGLAHTQHPFLLKPFTAKELAEKVRAVPPAAAQPPAAERRRGTRRPVQLRVRYRIEGGDTWRDGSALDVSECGILLNPAEPIEPGRRIELSLTLPKTVGARRAGPMTRRGYVTRRSATTESDFSPIGVFVAF